MEAIAFIDVLTTMNDLCGSFNCPIAVLIDVFDWRRFLHDRESHPKSKEVFIVPDERILGSGTSIHGFSDANVGDQSFGEWLPLKDGLANIHDILSAFSRNGVCVAGYGLQNFGFKVLNDNFKRVLGAPPVPFGTDRVLDVERLSKILVDVRKCGNYSQSSVLAALDPHGLPDIQSLPWHRRRIITTERLLWTIMNNLHPASSLAETIAFTLESHHIDVFQSGKYKGMPIEDVYNIDRQYFTWILRNRQLYSTDQDMLAKVSSILDRED